MALRGLEVAFGDEFMVIRSATDYELNPRIAPIIKDLGRNDPDERVRDAASRLLDPDSLKEKVDRRLKARNQPEKG
jgi:hypothetical protein